MLENKELPQKKIYIYILYIYMGHQKDIGANMKQLPVAKIWTNWTTNDSNFSKKSSIICVTIQIIK